MIYPVDLLIKDQNLITINEDDSVNDAFVLMISNDFSQIPLVDELGNLSGLISERSISRHYFHLGDDAGLLDMKVGDCCEKPEILSLESDVLDVLGLLRRTASVVIVNNKKPVGIITNTDVIEFFRDLAEGLVLIEDMEVTLRQYIDETFPTDGERDTALLNAFSSRRKQDGSLDVSYDRLTLGDYISLISNKSNWERFNVRLEPKTSFQKHLNHVREIRNQLVHFRGRLDEVQYDRLRTAHNWLERRNLRKNRKGTSLAEGLPSPILTDKPEKTGQAEFIQGKYGPLRNWLESQSETAKLNHTFEITFADIENIIGDTFPHSARQHRAWWANDSTSSRQAGAWMTAGWAVEDVDFKSEIVKFKRTDTVLYQIFWADLTDRLKVERPGFSRNSKSFAQNYCSFSAGKKGFSYVWSFPSKQDELWTQLIIDTRHSDKTAAKRYFYQLKDQKEKIEQEVGYELHWDDQPDSSSAKIYASYPLRITSTPEMIEEAKIWAIDSIQRIAGVMQPRINELILDSQMSTDEVADDSL